MPLFVDFRHCECEEFRSSLRALKARGNPTGWPRSLRELAMTDNKFLSLQVRSNSSSLRARSARQSKF